MEKIQYLTNIQNSDTNKNPIDCQGTKNADSVKKYLTCISGEDIIYIPEKNMYPININSIKVQTITCGDEITARYLWGRIVKLFTVKKYDKILYISYAIVDIRELKYKYEYMYRIDIHTDNMAEDEMTNLYKEIHGTLNSSYKRYKVEGNKIYEF